MTSLLLQRPPTPFRIAIALVLALLPLLSAHASRILAVRGAVQVERNQQLVPVVAGSVMREADTLVVEPDGEALVRFRDGANMVLRGNSRVTFEELVQAGDQKKRRKSLKIFKGAAGLRLRARADPAWGRRRTPSCGAAN